MTDKRGRANTDTAKAMDAKKDATPTIKTLNDMGMAACGPLPGKPLESEFGTMRARVAALIASYNTSMGELYCLRAADAIIKEFDL